MSDSAIGAVFTYLLTNVPTAVHAVNANTAVVDGPIIESYPPFAPVVFIGATNPDSDASLEGTRSYVQLGRMSADEEFTIPCYIDAVVGNEDQSAVRNAALGAYNAIVHLVHSDMTLGGALQAGRIAMIDETTITQTNPDADANESRSGRRCVIEFRIHCENHYTP